MAGTADAFGELRRFHVYDHAEGDFVMSGCQFPEGPCVVRHEFDEDLTEFGDPGVLTEGSNNLDLVWEDGEGIDEGLDATAIPMESANRAAQSAIEAVADELDVDPDRVRVANIQAPDRVEYFLIEDVGVEEA